MKDYVSCLKNKGDGVVSGLKLIDLELNIDDRGCLTEIFRIDWSELRGSLASFGDKVKQVYVVENNASTIRAFHVHETLRDYFFLAKGYAKFIFIDAREKSLTFGQYEIMDISEKKPQLISVPPGVFHGWKGSAGSRLVSMASELYRGEDKEQELDEQRIDWKFLGERIWETKFK